MAVSFSNWPKAKFFKCQTSEEDWGGQGELTLRGGGIRKEIKLQMPLAPRTLLQEGLQ